MTRKKPPGRNTLDGPSSREEMVLGLCFSGFAVAAQHVHDLMTHHVADTVAGIRQVLTGIENSFSQRSYERHRFFSAV